MIQLELDFNPALQRGSEQNVIFAFWSLMLPSSSAVIMEITKHMDCIFYLFLEPKFEKKEIANSKNHQGDNHSINLEDEESI